jgi:hypothetical protein
MPIQQRISGCAGPVATNSVTEGRTSLRVRRIRAGRARLRAAAAITGKRDHRRPAAERQHEEHGRAGEHRRAADRAGRQRDQFGGRDAAGTDGPVDSLV